MVNTPVHSVSAGWDRTACEGVSLKLPDSGLLSALWFADILSRTVKKTKESVSHLLSRKGKIFVPHHPDAFQLWTCWFYSTMIALTGCSLIIIVTPPKTRFEPHGFMCGWARWPAANPHANPNTTVPSGWPLPALYIPSPLSSAHILEVVWHVHHRAWDQTLYSPTYRPEPEHRPHSTAASWMFSQTNPNPNWFMRCQLCYSEE